MDADGTFPIVVNIGTLTAHSGCVLHSGHGAIVIVVFFHVGVDMKLTTDGTVLADGWNDGSDSEIVGHIAAVVSCNGTILRAVGDSVGDSEGGGTGAMVDLTISISSNDATVTVGLVLNGVNEDIGCNMAVADGVTVFVDVIPTHDTASVLPGRDAGVGKFDVFDRGIGQPAEDTLVFVSDSIATLIDAYAADGVVVAVEVTIKVEF